MHGTRDMVPNSSCAIAYSVPPSWADELSTGTDSPFPRFPAFCSVLTKARLNREKRLLLLHPTHPRSWILVFPINNIL